MCGIHKAAEFTETINDAILNLCNHLDIAQDGPATRREYFNRVCRGDLRTPDVREALALATTVLECWTMAAPAIKKAVRICDISTWGCLADSNFRQQDKSRS